MFASWMHYQAYLLEGLTRTGHWQQGSSPRSNPTGLVIYAWLILQVYVAHRTLILYMSIYSSIAWVGGESAVPEEHPSIAEGKEEEGRNDQDSPMMRGSPSLLSLLLSFFPLILLLRRRRTIYEQEVEVCVVCASICGEHCSDHPWHLPMQFLDSLLVLKVIRKAKPVATSLLSSCCWHWLWMDEVELIGDCILIIMTALVKHLSLNYCWPKWKMCFGT